MQVDAVTGMVMNLVELKQIMHKAILDPLDHKVRAAPCRAVRCVALRCRVAFARVSDNVGRCRIWIRTWSGSGIG